MIRLFLATALLAAVIIGGFFYGAASTVCADIGIDW